MNVDTAAMVCQHYEANGDVDAALLAVTAALAAFPDGPLTAAQLGGIDQFHVRGLAATAELAQLADIGAGMQILDAGCGLGGPSRYLAETFEADVTGVDLSPSFVAIANLLARRAGVDGLVRYRTGNLLALDFDDASFDLVWTQHVVMNIADRSGLYRELRRVLRPGGKLVFYDVIAADDGSEPTYPVPWATEKQTSFLRTMADTVTALSAAGFSVDTWQDVTAQGVAWFAQARAPAPQAPSLATVMGPRFPEMASNLARSFKEGRIGLAMGVCTAGAPGTK